MPTTTIHSRQHFSKKISHMSLWFVFFFLAGCADPADVDVQLQVKAPEVKITSYTPVLRQLGLMTEIFDTGVVKIQSQDISDNTGASTHTGGEIQRNITEMVKSTLNSVGGNVVFIEYDPAYIQNQTVTGYSDFSNKVIPDVVITGGITEFDRGLETRGDGTDFGANAEFTGLPDFLPSKEAGVRYSDDSKSGIARITLDFNMKNFQTLAGIARMNTVFSIEVSKALGKREIGVTLFGATFGRKGSIKKVQGRHEAVRILVQASMIQMVGKYLVLPYWRLLGDDALPDQVVQSALTRSYHGMNSSQRVTLVQEWLLLHGYDAPLSGVLDNATEKALQSFSNEYQLGSGVIGAALFSNIYTTIPITYETLARRQSINSYYANQQQPLPAPVVPAAPQQAPVEIAVKPEKAPPSQQAAPVAEKPEVTELQSYGDSGQSQPVATVAAPLSKVPVETQSAPAATTVPVVKTQTPVKPESSSVAKKPDSVPTTLERRGMASRGKVGRLLSDDDW